MLNNCTFLGSLLLPVVNVGGEKFPNFFACAGPAVSAFVISVNH